MILGYFSIGLAVLIILVLAISRTEKPWPYYIGAYVVGGILLLSTTLASSQLVGSDIHLEYYYANQAILNGWDISLPCTVNSCLPVTILAPFLSGYDSDRLIWIFKVVFPLLYALVPVLLVYIYSRFMPIKWAFLSAMVFVIVPTFFLEMPSISRQMIAELVIVATLALLMSKHGHIWKMAGLLAGSILVIVSHYSTATFWLVILASSIIGYGIQDRKAHTMRWLDVGVIFAVSVGFFLWYSRWASSGWQVVDYTNTIISIVGSTNSGNIGTPSSLNINWIPIIASLVLTFGVYRLLKAKIDILYKVWVITAFALLLVGAVFPQISNTINFSRYYHMMLIILAPVVIFTFRYKIIKRTTTCLIVAFLFSSGLIFNLLKIDNIEYPNIPYSIALENQRLDAGNYLTADDRRVAKWASENGIKEVYGDAGGVLALQDYFSLYQTHSISDALPDGYLFLRSWNIERGTFAYWVGPGLRIQKPLPEIDRPIVYQSGKSILYGVK
jgi:uncharacterized membrane protein